MKLAYAAVAAALLAASPVKAQVVDLSTITCADFSARPADPMANIMFWLEGYYTLHRGADRRRPGDVRRRRQLSSSLGTLDCRRLGKAPGWHDMTVRPALAAGRLIGHVHIVLCR